MSGRNLVSEMREGGRMPKSRVARFGLMDVVLALVAIAAIGAAGYFGVSAWTSPPSPPAPAPVALTGNLDVAWTAADAARCKSRAVAAANAPVPVEA